MKEAGAALAMLALAAPGALAQAAPLPGLEAGGSIFWVTQFEGGSDRYRERIVEIGPDWILYETLSDYEDDMAGPGENMFLIFSGIEFRGCEDDDFPTREERDAMAALYPFTEGASAELNASGDARTVRVGEATEFFLMGAQRKAHKVMIDFGDEELDEELTILDDAPLTVRIDWTDSGEDRVLAIYSASDTPLPEPTADDLGACAGFLEAERDNQ